MPLDTYANLQAAVLAALARPDDPLVAPAVPDMVRLFESEAKRRLKVGGGETAAFLTVTGGNQAVDLPNDCGSIRSAEIMTTGLTDSSVLQYLAPQSLSPLLNTSGRPQYYALFGSSARTGGGEMQVAPIPDTAYTIGISYLRDLPPLSDANPSNWLLESSPDAYFFGVLVEAEMYVGHDERVTMWLQRRDLAFASIEKSDIKARWSGPLQLRADGITIGGRTGGSGGSSGGGGGGGSGGVTFPLLLPGGGVITAVTGWIGIGKSAPAAPLDIGTSIVAGVDPTIYFSRIIDNASGSGNAHGITDANEFSRSGDFAYSFCDAHTHYTGPSPNHFVGFQTRPVMDFTGTMGRFAGHDSRIEGDSTGNIVNVSHFQVIGGGSDFAGTIGYHAGFNVPAITNGSDAWGVWSGTGNRHKFGSTLVLDNKIQMASTLNAALIYFGGDTLSGLSREAGSTIGIRAADVVMFKVGATRSYVTTANDGSSSVLELEAFRAAAGTPYGNPALTFAGPNDATAAGGTTRNRAYIVLPQNAAAASANLLLCTSATGAGVISGAAGTIRTAADMLIDVNSDGRVDFYRGATNFARFDAVAADGFITWATAGPQRFSFRNTDTSAAAYMEVGVRNGGNLDDSISLIAPSTAFTGGAAWFTAGTGILAARANLAGGLSMVAAATAASARIYSNGASLAATFSGHARPSLIVGNAALAPAATDGFLYIPGGAGPPTGVPTAAAGRVPFYYDSTNDQLYIYNGGWKQPKTPAAAAVVTWQ